MYLEKLNSLILCFAHENDRYNILNFHFITYFSIDSSEQNRDEYTTFITTFIFKMKNKGIQDYVTYNKWGKWDLNLG